VVTKDDDFVQSFLLRNTSQRLLLVASGNIGNAELELLIDNYCVAYVAKTAPGKIPSQRTLW
jgi:predicted nuclease of predicted toxin-antitoxin system